jgi:hypothetical protein
MPDQEDSQDIPLMVDLINNAVVSHAQLHQPCEGTGKGLGSKGIKVFGKPAEFLEDTLGDGPVKARHILRRFRQEFYPVHLPFHAQAAGNLSSAHDLARCGRLVEGPMQALLDFLAQRETRVRVAEKIL